MKVSNQGSSVAKRFVRVAAAALVASLALAPSMASAANQDNAGAPDVNPQPVSKLKKGGTFIWATTQLCDNYNTSHVDGNFAGCSYLMSGLLPGTFYTDEQGAFQVDKNYFTDIALTSRKPQTITYTLNPKAKWSDGKAISLADFVGYWKANNGTNEAFEIVSSTGYEDIESVTKGASANQVVVKFKNVYADWQGLFGGLLPASVTSSPDKFNSSWKDAPTLSAGPFKWGGTDKVAGTAWIVPNSAWWGDKPVLDKMLWKVVTAAAQLDALANGEVDAANTGPDANQYKRGLGLAGVDVRVSVAPNYRHMTFGNTGFMTDTRVRQAIQMGIDRNVITKWNWEKETEDTLLVAEGCTSNNGTKSTPGLCADLFGDWREEVVLRTTDNRELRIYSTTIPTAHRGYTLMHDPVYRLSIAWQNSAYNQPPYVGFYLGAETKAWPRPDITLVPTR